MKIELDVKTICIQLGIDIKQMENTQETNITEEGETSET